MRIEYESQRLSVRFFMLMLVLFILQVLFGVLLAAQRVDQRLLAGVLNFNVARAEHLNLAVMWIVSGFVGAVFYVAPLLSRRELAAPWLIKLLFWALIVIVAWNAFTFHLIPSGIAGWWAGQPWLQQGLEYLEAGRAAGIATLIGFAIVAYVVLRTFPPVREWNEIHWGLGIGFTALAVMWIFGLFFVARVDLQEYFRWFVVHYWVEGVWEVIHISLVGFLLVLLFNANVRAVGYAVFWGVTLVWLSGLLGNAHHYFWIGTPSFWQFWGSLFSAFEPLPLVFCFWHIYLDAHHDNRPLANAPAFYFVLGSVVLEQVGAGILGFSMTFSLTNAWSHGTLVTPAHAHLALFGTFGMLCLGVAYVAVPSARGLERFDQRLGRLAFWFLFVGVLGLSLSFALGGTKQVFLYRVLGEDWFGGVLMPALTVFDALLVVSGFVLLVGAGIAAYDLITMGRRAAAAAHHLARHAAGGLAPQRGRWASPLSGFEAATWLVVMWVFGAIITMGLLSYNLASVRMGNPDVPYVAAWIGYPGLLVVTLLFVSRFLTSLEARQEMAA